MAVGDKSVDPIKYSEQNIGNREHDEDSQSKRVVVIKDLYSYNYEYMGKQTSGDYIYYGFKENGGTNYKIMRKDSTDDSAWQYAYGTSGWTTAWSDPTALTYGDPPES